MRSKKKMINEIRETLLQCFNDLYFNYNGKKCGVSPKVYNSTLSYQVWYGDSIKTFSNITDVLNNPFYDGKSLKDIVGDIDYYFT